MKLDARQDQLLKHYLRKVFLYRETYEEVYDHMISALQEQPYTQTFQDAVNDIIRRDFGGHNNLISMENNCKKAMVKELRHKQFGYFISFFKFPYLLLVMGFSLGVYLMMSRSLLSPHTLRWIFWGMALLPYVAIPLRFFYTGYLFGETKRSIRDSMMGDLSMLPMRVFIAVSVLYVINGLYTTAFYPGALMITIGVVIYTIYFLAYFKLSKDEVKVRMIS
ncbi:hypothetical protein [Mucilaginibacter dorajii]|uniref:DUF1700 domain-containing protein n=1 Tax=Mucilaginibacter dorajii TaxID=692994 RepID=A0ABP7PJP3_9SPHI|nr:hypothetical protein [Mucilaginibacter dorajii]MCS3733469.1 putative membrane protein YgcG [Mucilaginibacter dorajii]